MSIRTPASAEMRSRESGNDGTRTRDLRRDSTASEDFSEGDLPHFLPGTIAVAARLVATDGGGSLLPWPKRWATAQ